MNNSDGMPAGMPAKKPVRKRRSRKKKPVPVPVEVDPEVERQERELRMKINQSLNTQQVLRTEVDANFDACDGHNFDINITPLSHQQRQLVSNSNSLANNHNHNVKQQHQHQSSHYLSAAAIIKSGRVSDAVQVLLQDEKNTSAIDNSNNGDADTSNSKRAVENAARLALLLTKSFVNNFANGQECRPTARNFTHVQLADFFIHFDQVEASTISTSSRKAPPEQNNFQQQGGLYYDGNENNSNANPTTSHPPLKNDGTIITLRGVDIISPGDRSPTNISDEEPSSTKTLQIQALGKILYSAFCHGQPLPEDILGILSSQYQGNEEFESFNGSVVERSARRLRVTEKTIFGALVESTALPKSICRFLADMIDAKMSSSDSSPFVSFEDVMLDLEQMISQPRTFLHDSQFSPASDGFHFGQKYYSRREEVATLMKLAVQIMDPSSQLTGVQAAFISGIAGSGKSRLAQSIAENLSSLSGWIVINAKFERSIEHASRGIVSSMFDEIVKYLVTLKESHRPADVAYSQIVSKSIMDSIGIDTLSGLVDFLPSLPLLFCDIVGVHAESATWQLALALKTIIGAVLESGKYLMICCDDLQWSDKVAFSLISDVLIDVGFHEHSRQCLFMGMYRSNEIDNDHSFYIQYSKLQDSRSVSVTEEIMLSNLLKGDVICMMMAEFQLPRRIVAELAEEVYKKTTGHAFFVVELLNSLLRDSIITYSTEKCRYAWEDPVIIETGNSVAELIASNLKLLAPESLQILQILSCFGIQTDYSMLQILETFRKGIMCSIDDFVEKGILDQAGPIVIFSHDLIHEESYRSMDLDKGKTLHMEIGQFLGATVDAPLAIEAVTRDFGQLQVMDQPFFSGRNLASTLISLSCDQVNAAGPDYIINQSQKEICAKWNLSAGQSFALQANYSAAQYYFTNGITFLGLDSWSFDQLLCLQLHQGAVLSSFALGEADKVDQYAQKVIENVPFEDTLDVQVVVLKSFTQSGRHDECVSRGIDILRRLGFQIPLAPSPQSIGLALASTASMASQYSSDQIAILCQESKDDSTYVAVRITDALYISAQAQNSPFVPLIACEAVKFSLQNGCCPEAAMSFATVAFVKICLEGDYVEGKYWSEMARIILRNSPNKNINSEIRTEIMLHITIDNYFEPPRVVTSKLLNRYQEAMRIGQVDSAILALIYAWRYRLMGGHNLSLILNDFEDRLELTAKHSKYSAKFVALDAMLLLELTGITIDCSSVFGYSISNVDDIGFENKSSKDNRWLHNFYLCKMLICYWKENYIEAEEHNQLALAYPMSKTPQFSLIYQTFFGGLNALQLHRQLGGRNDQRLKQGKDAMKKLGKWADNSMVVFVNKWLLLQAEYSASVGEHDKAQSLYLASIDAAKDHGHIHELALAHELLGNYYCSANGYGVEDSDECFRKAILYYKQWGATTLAEKLMRKHNLRMDSSSAELQLGNSKHPREGDPEN